MQILYNFEVDLTAIYIDAHHLYGHGITQNIVFGVLDGSHMNKSFAAGFIQLHKEPEIGDAGYMSVQDFAHMFFHPKGLELLN